MDSVKERLSRLAVNNEGFVFDPATGESYTLNATGLLVLRALEAGQDTKQIAATLADEFEVEADEAEKDIADFVTHLRSYNLG